MELIHNIQGSGTASPLNGNTVTIEGIVVGDFQDGAGTNGDLNGFFVQEEDADADGNAATSEGIFIFDGSNPAVNVQVGDKVQVTGEVKEFFGLTQLTNITNITVVSSGNALPTATDISLPVAATVTNSDGELIPDLEQYEGMLVRFTDTLSVTEMFQLDRFGEVRASQGGRLEQFTQSNAPNVAGFAAHQQNIARRTIVIDDGQSVQNPDPILFPDGSLSTADGFRMGNTVTNLTGVVTFSRGSGSSGDENYRIHPTVAPTFTPVNTRPARPDNVGGNLKVAGFNVLNYFTTLDEGSNTTANGNNPRGADNTLEFNRQTEKLVTTLSTLDADILGLVELENDFQAGNSGNAIESLVNSLNASVGAGTYDWVNPGTQFVGDDAIAVGFIYKPSKVSLSGTPSILATPAFLDPNNSGENRNRAALAQTFTETASGESFTAVVNHFKSKGSSGLTDTNNPDFDQLDGQGFWSDTRADAATALVNWLNTDPTNSGDSDVLILGDLNAYAQEDAITNLENSGYTDLAQQFLGSNAYSFVFDGQTGTLDYALANSSLLSQVTGTTEWHVNADETDAIDYNTDFGRNTGIFDGSVPFRNSDHDPIIVGLNLGFVAPTPAPTPTPTPTDPQAPPSPTPTPTPTPGNGGNGTVEISLNAEQVAALVASLDNVPPFPSANVTSITVTGNNTFDILPGSDENETFNAGGGADIVIALGGDDNINGEAGADLLIGNQGRDILSGGTENDIIFGGQGDDAASGGDGDDLVSGDRGNDLLQGDAGNDQLFGGSGNDNINGGPGNDVAYGGRGDDLLRGGENDDILIGNLGNDGLRGDAGNDWLSGNQGADFLDGGVGNDTLRGGRDSDTLLGGDGDDMLYGDIGNDSLVGGIGSDVFVVRMGHGTDRIADLSTGDRIGLAGGLTFQQLQITQTGANVTLTFGNEILAILEQTNVTAVSGDRFFGV